MDSVFTALQAEGDKMKRIFQISLIAVYFVVLALAAAARALDPSDAAPISGKVNDFSWCNCTAFIAGRNTTEDGSIPDRS
jgi:hypothetical protein